MPIYKLYKLRWTDAWYQLSEEEQKTLLDKVVAVCDRVGGHKIVDCKAGWASESWHFFGVEEYPNMDSVQEHRRLLEELDWFRYIDSDSMLGTCVDTRAGNE